jgi:hypothetical protein
MLNPAWATANDPTAFNVSKFKVGKHYLPSQAALLEPLRYGTFFYTAFIEDINREEKKQLLLRIPLRSAGNSSMSRYMLFPNNIPNSDDVVKFSWTSHFFYR